MVWHKPRLQQRLHKHLLSQLHVGWLNQEKLMGMQPFQLPLEFQHDVLHLQLFLTRLSFQVVHK